VKFQIDGRTAYAATGGRAHAATQPFAVFVHGAGLDHTVWALQSRWLAFHGWNVLAVDLPGHGRSDGPLRPSIAEMADWVLQVTAAAGAGAAALIGHSMGALIALEAAARQPERVNRLVLVGSAASMPVHPELLAAARANEHAAIDMVNLWGYGHAAGLGGSAAPGVWMVGAGERLLEQAAAGVLYNDLAACAAYADGLASAARVRTPTLLISGSKDQMTPLRNARTLAAAITGAELVALEEAGHMLLAERPDELLAALQRHLRVDPGRGQAPAASAGR
jgi:pimeloyl-ACP methyl ester carboxylesterase